MKSGKARLMVVGAGQFQVPLIDLGKRMGFETIAVSIPGNYRGFLVADKFYEIDVREKEVILEIGRREGISGIVTDQTDLAVPTVAYVAEKLGLPGIGYDCALRITNKLRNREHCKKHGFPIPKFSSSSSLAEAWKASDKLGFPLVVKPSDSQGSRGVSKINDPGELPAKFQNAYAHSADGVVLLEEFIPGEEIMPIGFVSDFKYVNLAVQEKMYFDLPDMFIARQVISPVQLNEDLRQKVVNLNRQLFESLSPNFGVAFGQYRVNKETGDICLIEAAIRGPAGYTSSHLLPLISGIEADRLLIEFAVGQRKTVEIKHVKIDMNAAAKIYFYLPEGVICQMKGIGVVNSMPGVEKVELGNLQIGGETKPLTDATGRGGPILITAQNRSACEEIIQNVQETMLISVRSPHGIEAIIWK